MDDVVVMRSQLAGALATKFQVRDRVAQEVVTLIVNNIQKTLERGGRVEIRGFGVFMPRYRPGRIGRNPSSGKSVPVPARYTVQFRPGKSMRESVDFHRLASEANETP